MTNKTESFQKVIDKNFKKVDLYTTALTRVHGQSHPEVFKVRELFEAIKSKVISETINKPDLDAEFSQLRQVTQNYKIPTDVCEAYEDAYNMLSEIDQAYQAK